MHSSGPTPSPRSVERVSHFSCRTLLESNWILDESAAEETLSGRGGSGCLRKKTIKEWEAGDSTFRMSFSLKNGTLWDAWQDKLSIWDFLREDYFFFSSKIWYFFGHTVSIQFFSKGDNSSFLFSCSIVFLIISVTVRQLQWIFHFPPANNHVPRSKTIATIIHWHPFSWLLITNWVFDLDKPLSGFVYSDTKPSS